LPKEGGLAGRAIQQKDVGGKEQLSGGDFTVGRRRKRLYVRQHGAMARWSIGKDCGWRGTIEALPDVQEKDRTNVAKLFEIVTSLVKNSGIEDISGAGLSSIAIEKDYYHSKFILHHYKGRARAICGRSLASTRTP